MVQELHVADFIKEGSIGGFGLVLLEDLDGECFFGEFARGELDLAISSLTNCSMECKLVIEREGHQNILRFYIDIR